MFSILFKRQISEMIKASAKQAWSNFALTCRCFFLSFHFLLPHMSYISIRRIQNDQLWKWRRGTLHCARKRNGNYGQCQIIELVVRDMLITDGDAEDLSLRTLGDRLSLLLMSCFRGEIVPRKHHRYYKLASCSLVYPILLELTESNWPAHIHALYFLYSHQQCR